MKRPPVRVQADLAPRFGADPAQLVFLGGGQEWSDGTLYSFRSGGTDRIVKFISFPAADREGLERAEDRVRFVRTLGEAGCRICVPEASPRGHLFETCEHEGTTWLAYAYRKVPGRVAKDDDPWVADGSLFRAMGGVLAGLHAASRSRGDVLRPDGSSEASRVLRGWRHEWSSFHAGCRDGDVRTAWVRLRARLELLPIDPAGYGFVHNDAHAWNMVVDPERAGSGRDGDPELTVIDFDVANYHWYMNDAAVAVYSALVIGTGEPDASGGPPRGRAAARVDAFWEGYRHRRNPGAFWIDRLDLFLQYRRILMFTVFQGVTEKHPAWRGRWKRRILEEDARLG